MSFLILLLIHAEPANEKTEEEIKMAICSQKKAGSTLPSEEPLYKKEKFEDGKVNLRLQQEEHILSRSGMSLDAWNRAEYKRIYG